MKNPSYATLISIMGGYGPALAAIAVSRVLNTKPTKINPFKRWGIFLVIFCLVLPLALFHPYLKLNIADPVIILLCGIITAISAFIISSIFSRKTGARDLMVSLVKWKINPVWYLVALFAWPILYLVSNIINTLFTGGTIFQYTTSVVIPSPPYLVLFFLSTFFVTAGVAEEPGWRGFALPKLQSLYNPLVASIIICLIWQIWHIPLYFTGLYPFDVTEIILRIIPIALPSVLLFTWLYNRSKGSLLIAVLFHTSLDVSGGILPLQGSAFYILTFITSLVMIIFIIKDKMWKKVPEVKAHAQKMI